MVHAITPLLHFKESQSPRLELVGPQVRVRFSKCGPCYNSIATLQGVPIIQVRVGGSAGMNPSPFIVCGLVHVTSIVASQGASG